MSYKNDEMLRMVESLAKHLDRKDIIGYAAARNTRILGEELTEYVARRDELIEKYGEPCAPEDNAPMGAYKIAKDSPNLLDYAQEVEQWAVIEHDPRIFKIPSGEVIGKLSGAEILEIDWMIED